MNTKNHDGLFVFHCHVQIIQQLFNIVHCKVSYLGLFSGNGTKHNEVMDVDSLGTM